MRTKVLLFSAIMASGCATGAQSSAAGPAAARASMGVPGRQGVHREVEKLLADMVAAFKTNPSSVSRFYTDDATIMGGGARYTGRESIDKYWAEGSMFADWKLELLEAGDGTAPWVRGRSTLVGRSGRSMVTEFLGVLKRQPDGQLKFYLDMYVAASPMARRAPGSADAATTRGPGDSELRARVDSFITARTASGEFSGSVLVARNGTTIYERAAWLADVERSVSIAPDTRIQIASATKLFTQIAIRQLIQRGLVNLDDTVGKFIPDYPNATVRSRATIEHLLRHRSGIGSFWNAAWMERRAQVKSVDDYLRLFWQDELLFTPGEAEAYSNGGYVVLGAIIERVTGERYHDYLKKHVFAPAGMDATVPSGASVSYANTATGYTRQPGMTASAPARDPRLAGPGAGVRRTPATGAGGPEQGGRRVLRGPDGREMSDEEIRQMRERMSSMPRRPNTSFAPGLSGPAGDHYSTVGDFLRLANALRSGKLLDSVQTTAMLSPRWKSGLDFRANGGGPGVNAEFSMYPTGEVVVVLSNYDPPSATAVADFIRAIVGTQARREGSVPNAKQDGP
jgi:D-alanyl-D-alanine carboxypeptidase